MDGDTEHGTAAGTAEGAAERLEGAAEMGAAGPALVILDGAGRVTGWSPAAAALPALAGLLRAGAPASALAGRLEAGSWLDVPLGGQDDGGGGGCVRLIGGPAPMPAAPAPGLSADRGSRLFAAASHDLRQPLAALSLLAGVLEGRVADPAARDVLKAMAAAVQSLKTMVDGHFDLARLEAGLIEPDTGGHPVNAILTRLALDFAPRFESRRLRFSVLPCSAIVDTDPALLDRILRALLSNALRNTERGRVLLGCRRSGADLLVGVWDSGRGLPADQLETLREELAGDAGGGRADLLLGMELALARGLAQRLGHALAVDSAPGRGAAYTVRLRRLPEAWEDGTGEAAAPPPPAAGAASAGDADVSRARVLVIEDDRLVLDALGVLLGEWGCAVTGADSFDAAMERLGPAPQRPDLVIADLRLKGAANGIVAIRQIAKALDADLPGLVLTGDTDPRRLREARLSGYPVLNKPVAPLALRAVLARLLGRHRFGL